MSERDPNHYVRLSGVDSPYLERITGHDYILEWDIQQPKGKQGAIAKLHGRKVAPYTLTFYLSTLPDDSGITGIQQWDAFERVLRSTVSGPQPLALPIYHPDLARNQITESVLEKIGGFARDDRGGISVAVTMLRFEPPKAKTPLAADSVGGIEFGEIEIDPNAERRARNARLREEAAKL